MRPVERARSQVPVEVLPLSTKVALQRNELVKVVSVVRGIVRFTCLFVVPFSGLVRGIAVDGPLEILLGP